MQNCFNKLENRLYWNQVTTNVCLGTGSLFGVAGFVLGVGVSLEPQDTEQVMQIHLCIFLVHAGSQERALI